MLKKRSHDQEKVKFYYLSVQCKFVYLHSTLFHHSLNFWNIEEIGHMKINKGELKNVTSQNLTRVSQTKKTDRQTDKHKNRELNLRLLDGFPGFSFKASVNRLSNGGLHQVDVSHHQRGVQVL